MQNLIETILASPYGRVQKTPQKLTGGCSVKQTLDYREQLMARAFSGATAQSEPSVIEGTGSSYRALCPVTGGQKLAQVLGQARGMISRAANHIHETIFPDGDSPREHTSQGVIRQVLALSQGSSATMPIDQARQQMLQFLNKKPMIAGQGVQPTGLDAVPTNTRAATMPGTPKQKTFDDFG